MDTLAVRLTVPLAGIKNGDPKAAVVNTVSAIS
jgi:hypothetical protein